jgi:hypothetical protein
MSATIDEAPVDLTEELSLHIGQLVSSKGGCFSCGGSIPVAIQPGGKSDRLTSPSAEGQTSGPAETAGSVMDSDVKTTSKPVTVRWDPPSAPPGECRSACFPLSACGTGTGMARLKALLQDCEPATFGRGRQDILDESYRKATKLDASAFAADFCPYSLGIVNTAAELLMPGVGLGWSRAVEAELYKLNVSRRPAPAILLELETLTFLLGLCGAIGLFQTARRHAALGAAVWLPRRVPAVRAQGRRTGGAP